MGITRGAAAVVNSIGTATSCGLTISATAGRSLALGFSWKDFGTPNDPTSLSSSGGESVTPGGAIVSANGASTRLYYIPEVAATGSLTVTCNWGSAVYAGGVMAEYIGCDPAAFIDDSNEAPGFYNGGGGGDPTVGLVTAFDNSAIFAIVETNGAEPTVGGGYTVLTLPNYYNFFQGQDLIDAGSAGSKTVSMGLASFGDWSIAAMAMKALPPSPDQYVRPPNASLLIPRRIARGIH